MEGDRENTEIKVPESFDKSSIQDSTAINQINMKALWMRMSEEISHLSTSKDVPSETINELALVKLMHEQVQASTTPMTISMNSVKIMSKACEMFVLDLAMRSHQAKKLQDSGSAEEEDVITEEDVMRALCTSEIHDMYVP